CESLRFSAGRGHDEDVRIAGVRRGECNLRSIGRKVRFGFGTWSRCQSPCLAARARGDPQVAGVFEGDRVLTDGRMAEEARALGGQIRDEQNKCEESRFELHLVLKSSVLAQAA